MVDLRAWYGPDAVIHRAVILREMDGSDSTHPNPVKAAERIVYAKGTTVLAFIDDPERPGLADIQLPNGKLMRVMLRDIALDDPDDPILGL